MYVIPTNLNLKQQASSLTDESLVKTIVSTNNTSLFEFIYIRHKKMVYNICLGFSKGDHEAKDLTQDIFLKLLDKLKSFKGESKLSTWLYRFAYNHCVNYVQRNPTKRIEKKYVDLKYLENMSYETQDDDSINQLKVDKFRIAYKLISHEDKVILSLKYQDSLSIKELASNFDLGESAVKMRLKRAREKLINVYYQN